MLTYEGISDNREITYWDYKKTSFVTKELHKELLNDINYFKIYSEMKGMQSKDMQRSSEDEAIITGTFILNIKPTNLYNRFKRKFGNKLKWFRFTPKMSLSFQNIEENLINLIFVLTIHLSLVNNW